MIFYKGFDGLVRSQTEAGVEVGRSFVTILGTLPEQTLVVAQEGSALHLRLVFENRVTFLTQLFGAQGHSHFDVVDFPFGPGTTIHPDAAIFHPLFVLDFVDSGQNGIEANLVSSVRVGQVAGYENLVRFNRLNQVFYDKINVIIKINAAFFIKPSIQI